MWSVWQTISYKYIHTQTCTPLATYTSCTSLRWCWILRATYLTAVMNKTTTTWSCVCGEVLLTCWLLNELLWLAAWQLLALAGVSASTPPLAMVSACIHDNPEKKLPDKQPAAAAVSDHIQEEARLPRMVSFIFHML